KLDISRIEIGSDCSLGYMRNDFSYDENHRVTRMLNTFFNPDPIVGRYNTSYKYDAAGNITRLNRYGLVDASAGQYTYGLIDSLVYTYANGDSRLSAIEDFVPAPLAEQKGFEIAGAFGYDGNGNFTSDGDQGLAIASNLINLPRIVASPSDSLLLEYTFGGEKIRKLQTGPVARERIYLGGAEFVNDTLELYHHAEGRVVWRDTTPAFQYRIADHLGNTVVFFEDRDGDTKIKTEQMTSDPDSLEVLQRNHYYPFGMEIEGPWQAATAPRADYLYNGKELEEDLGLNWYAYGFRYYDASIGRFTGVDPLAAQFAWVSVYNYAENEPVGHIDLWGLQKALSLTLVGKNSEGENYVILKGEFKEGSHHFSVFSNQGHYGKRGLLEVYLNVDNGVKFENFSLSPLDIIRNFFERQDFPKGGVEFTLEIGKGRETRSNPDAPIGPAIDDLLNAFTAAKGAGDLPSKPETFADLAEFLNNSFQTTDALQSTFHSEGEKEVRYTESDSLICPACNHKQDSAHIDRIHGKGKFKELQNGQDE
ncbi:MAG: RHS repeat-associated core domain-containing protein, partial [Saprospiraceae bacterium]